MNSEAGKGGHELVATNARFTSGWTDDALTSVTYTKALDGRVAVITLSRPEQRNAWTEIMRNEVCEWGVCVVMRCGRSLVYRYCVVGGLCSGRVVHT